MIILLFEYTYLRYKVTQIREPKWQNMEIGDIYNCMQKRIQGKKIKPGLNQAWCATDPSGQNLNLLTILISILITISL